jgi:AcrR family transcriptional regulator
VTGTDSLFFRWLERSNRDLDERAGVAASQRARLLDGMVRAVAAKGYARTTVADVVRLAGVSRRTFYEQFSDKEDCFLAAYEAGSQVVLDEVAAAVRELRDPDWRTRLRVALETYTAVMAAEPDFARPLNIDVLGAGPRAVELRQRVFERYVSQYRRLRTLARADDPSIGTIPDKFLHALVGGIGELVQQHIVTQGARSLTDLSPTLVAFATAVIEGAGVEAPAPTARRPQTRGGAVR